MQFQVKMFLFFMNVKKISDKILLQTKIDISSDNMPPLKYVKIYIQCIYLYGILIAIRI